MIRSMVGSTKIVQRWVDALAEFIPDFFVCSPELCEAEGALRISGPEADHPLNGKLKEIRGTLIDAARAKGINEPWLERWWEHLAQATEGVHTAQWGSTI